MTTDSKRVEEIAEKLARNYYPALTDAEDIVTAMSADIFYLLAEVDRLNADLQQERWNPDRLVAWMDDEQRKPATQAFTAGGERQIAYRVEQLLAEIGRLSGEGAHADGCAAIERIWKVLGIESYEDAKGKSVDEHVAELVALLAEKDAELAEVHTRLNAWQSVFGTTQLTHARARLEVAESKVTTLTARIAELEGKGNE